MIHKYLAILSVVVLAACATEGGEKTSSTQPAPQAPSGNTTQGMDTSAPDSGSKIDNSGVGQNVAGSEAALAEAMKSNIIYFAYDSSEVTTEGLKSIDAFGKYLSINGGAKLRLEGHADERGSREYNVALGERRAIAVQSALIARGAAPSQLSLISYGEERPAVAEHTEEAYAKNRRVEIVRP